VDGLGEALGLEISDDHRKVIDGINRREPPPQGATVPLHREIIAACPCLTAFFETVEDWGALSAQLLASGEMTAPPNLDGTLSGKEEDQGDIPNPAARGRYGAVRAWRKHGAALLAACQPQTGRLS